MIGKIFGLFKSSNTQNSLGDSLSKMKLIGSFYKKVIGGQKESMAEECTMYMSIVNEKTFDYNLNVYNDEYQYQSKLKFKFNQPIYLDTWETISFALTNDRGFKFCLEKGKEALIWEFNRDFYIFYFLIDEENQKWKGDFLKALVNLVSSYEYAVDYAKAAVQEDNESYITQLDEVEDIAQFLEDNYSQIYSAFKKDESSSSSQIQIDSNVPLEKEFESKLKVTNELNFKKSFPTAKSIFEANGLLHRYDRNKDDLVVVSPNSVLGVYSVEAFRYYLVVNDTNSDKTFTCTGISQEMNLIINRSENLIMWLSKEDVTSNEMTAYNFVFFEESKAEALRKVMAKTQYEASTCSKYENLNEDDQHWLENENVPDEDEVSSSEPDVEMEMENEFQESTSELPNKVTTQAYLHDRTFVVRDNNTIGVYKTDEEDVLTHLANLPAVAKYEDKDIDIKNALMFQSDTNMILLDKNNPNSVFRYDLGKGKIIEEWSAESMKKIDALSQEMKFGQMTDSQIITGVNTNNLFTMDARINKKNKVVSSKSYKTNPKMNCLTTTEFGGIATGSLNGEVRLYNQVGKNAKTLLPCFGDPIRAIDVTADGKYLLSTCDKYLILIPTSCKGDKNGFTAQMGKEKPHPKTLKIKPIDINKYHLEKLSFTPARFNVNKVDGETNIISSMGDYVIIWNFSKIKKGILDDYKIKKVNQNIIENQFKFNRNQIVVTMENKLRIQNQKRLFTDNK